MRLSRLLRNITKDTYVSIGVNGDCLCTCKVGDINKKILDNDYKVTSVDAGVVYRDNESPIKINIYCKER